MASARPSSSSPLAPVLLVALGAAISLLALFQWMELLLLRANGTTVCGVNEFIDCEKVWEMPIAKGIHAALGIPVAGLGLVWGLAAFGLALTYVYRMLRQQETAAVGAAIKLTSIAGLVAVAVFAGASFSGGALCLTCLGTYLLVGGFALVALRQLPGAAFPESSQFKGAAFWAVGFSAAAYAVLLGPGLATPKSSEGSTALPKLAAAPKPSPAMPAGGSAAVAAERPYNEVDRALDAFIDRLPLPEQQRMSMSIAQYRHGEVPPGPAPAARRLYGSKDAPTKIVDWVDVRCGHCKTLNDTLDELKQAVPEGSISVEARNFPLDSECNPYVQMSDGLGIRCAAAKAMICLESQPDYWELRSRIFGAQRELTREKVLEIASSGQMKRPALEACLQDSGTAAKLKEDIEFAMKYQPEGTPLVVVNGREGTPVASFLYAMALTGGDASSPVFSKLPPPDLLGRGDGHEGHNH